MKNPNGFGSVVKLSGKRRKPFAARITIGWKDNGQQLYKYIGYYKTRAEGITALSDYHKDPYDLNTATITLNDIYELWSADKYILKDDTHPNGVSHSTVLGYKAAWKLCEEIMDMKISDLKLAHMQNIVDTSGKNYPTLRKYKVLMGQLFEYAIIHEMISKERDMVEYIDIKKAGNPNSIKRTPFSKKELALLWKSQDISEYMSVIFMLIYSGTRISEMLDLKREDVNLDEHYFTVTKSKTNAGIRKVPIANKILPFFEHWHNKKTEYLLSTPDGSKFTYRNYYDSYWTPLLKELKINHKPHDTRHTCVSLLTAANVDERFIKKIVGHKGQGVTQAVYTHLEIEELITAINSI